MTTTPMMQQYADAKAVCGDALLLFRMGDFYELFFEDARIAAEKVGLTLTSRDKNSDNPVPMAGFPYHALDGYLHKLIRAGYRVTLSGVRLINRPVTRVPSASTATYDS